MNLVPENINEAVKHLGGRSEEEIEQIMSEMPADERFNYAIDHKIKLTGNTINKILIDLLHDRYVKTNGQYNWHFSWKEGGYNEVWAATEDEAYKKASQICSLHPIKSSLRKRKTDYKDLIEKIIDYKEMRGL